MKDKTLTFFIWILVGALIYFICASIRDVYKESKQRVIENNRTYLYTITTPDRGTWETTNNLSIGHHNTVLYFDCSNQNMFISPPFVVSKKLYVE